MENLFFEISKISTFKTRVFIMFLTLTIFSCNSKSEKSNDTVLENNSEMTNPDPYCTEHDKDCEQLAKDLGMTIDEYHIWSEKVQSEIEMEDEMTDENGDIVLSNSSVSKENQNMQTQKQWVNCKYCHGTGLNTCRLCDGSGVERYGTGTGFEERSCGRCRGKTTDGNCNECEGRGQVLMEF